MQASFITPHRRGSEPRVHSRHPPWVAKGSSPAPWLGPATIPPDPSRLHFRLPVEVCACKHVPVRVHAPPLRPQRWTPADGRWLHQQPPRYCSEWGGTALAPASATSTPGKASGTRFPQSVPRGNDRLARSTENMHTHRCTPAHMLGHCVLPAYGCVCQLSSAQNKGQVADRSGQKPRQGRGWVSKDAASQMRWTARDKHHDPELKRTQQSMLCRRRVGARRN